jgi:AcrR family transcriptional regulator
VARPRAFDENEVLLRSKELFAAQGYNGTSIDDLVKATGLLRGSLYKAFGSKRNLFEKLFSQLVEKFDPTSENLDLLTVALKDLAPTDSQIRAHCRQIVDSNASNFAALLGQNLLSKMMEK